MVQLNTSVLVGDTVYLAGTDLPDELVDLVDSDDVFVGGRSGKKKKSKDDKKSDDTPGEIPEGAPSVDWNVLQLTAYAVGKEVDLGEEKLTKAEIVAVLEAAELAATENN